MIPTATISISLSRGQKALIDASDEALTLGAKWQANLDRGTGKYYAQRHVTIAPNTRTREVMHRKVIAAKHGELVDHVNGDTLDNRRSNLRIVTRSQNGQNRKPFKNNTSGKTGVIWYPPTKRWQVHITLNRKRHHLGYFKNIDDAIRVRLEAETRMFGQHSYRTS